MTNAKRKYKIVFRPGKPLTKVALLVVIVLSTVTLIALYGAKRHSQQRTEAMRAQAFAEEQERKQLQQDIAELGTPDSVEKIAEEELGLVNPDTVIIVTTNEK